jgi:heme exporter protein B
MDLFLAILHRDLILAMRRRIEALLPIVFFIVAVSLFPLGVGPEPQMLRQLAPGLVWVCALLAAMLSLTQLFAGDHADGSLEQLLLTGHGAIVVAAAKATAHWLVSGLPLVVCAPVIGLLFDMRGDSLAALTLGLRSAGVLIILLVLPLSIPALVFGTGAVAAIDAGISPQGHYSILGALLIFTALTAPPATAAALRIAVE